MAVYKQTEEKLSFKIGPGIQFKKKKTKNQRQTLLQNDYLIFQVLVEERGTGIRLLS